MGTLVLTVLLASIALTVLAEIPDNTAIYRIHHAGMFSHRNESEDGSTASLEVHLRTNVLGNLIKAGSNSYLDSPVGMSQFNCAPVVPKCPWQQRENWDVQKKDLTDVLAELVSPSVSNSCANNNGGCEIHCQDVRKVAVCSCPSGYSLNTDKKTCAGYGQRYKLTDKEGSFSSPNHPSSYNSNDDVLWLLVMPTNYRITLKIASFRTESGYDFLEVYDGAPTSAKLLGRYSGTTYSNTLKSTGNIMFISFHSDHSNTMDGFTIEYRAEPIGQPILTLSSTEGSLISPPFTPQDDQLCVSMIYKLESLSELWISASLSDDSSLKLTKTFTREASEWQIGRFKGTLPPEQIGYPISLSAHLIGEDSSIYSIMGCNTYDDEDVYIIDNSLHVDSIPRPQEIAKVPTVPQRKCYNGGVYLEETRECACPVGFIGSTCEEACGSNSYGKDCGGMCSGFERGCQEMIFCTEKLPCTCAPGFTGLHCDSQCNSGKYGVNCQMTCGHCYDGSCNIYTGECDSGCKPGYYPPICQDSYLALSEAPTIEHEDSSTVLISAKMTSLVGRGSVNFYQVQYKEHALSDWLKLRPQEPLGGTIIANITMLRPGIRHSARIILIDEDGSSNQDIGIPEVEFKTTCTVPTSKDYQLKSNNITSTSFAVSWQYDVSSPTTCPLTGYEVTFKDRWEEFKKNLTGEERSISFTGLIPGRTYSVFVKAITEFGNSPTSSVLRVSTKDKAPGEVTGLQVIPTAPGDLLVTWQKPRASGGTINFYLVDYQCLHLLACSIPCSNSSGQFEASDQTAILTRLHPHAQYRIKVAGMSAALGPFKTVLVTTDHTGANVAPDPSPSPIVHVTNTSVTVQWKAPTDCLWLNGYLYGYKYQLVTDSEGELLYNGTTEDTQVSFNKLIPHTSYQVQVYVVTSGGWSASHKLTIPVTTKATAPEQVQNLTVYKMGRRLIGIRWSPPVRSYGPIKSFTVSHRNERSPPGTEERVTINPVPCTAWPDFYCHTINRLTSDTSYMVSVQTRNVEVNIDGAPASIKATTRERAPGSPVTLRIVNRTQTSMVLEWGPPFMMNGVLRSFLVNVEEIDQHNSSACCEYFPIQELPVRAEQQFYRLEVGGLNPASTLTISVSAKTITMGSAVNITSSTPPDPPTLVYPPEIQPKASEDEPNSVVLRPSETDAGLQSTYLLLVLPPYEIPEPLFWDNELLDQLNNLVKGSFYPVAEFTPEMLIEEEEFNFGTGAFLTNGTLSLLEDPKLSPGIYRTGLVLVLDYCGSKSVGFAASDSFEFS